DEIWVEIDDVKLLQVINNLLLNSIKFTHDGGIIELQLKEGKDNWLVTVKDDGIGIRDLSSMNLAKRKEKVGREKNRLVLVYRFPKSSLNYREEKYGLKRKKERERLSSSKSRNRK